MAKITVLGSGGWGMALAISANKCGNNVTLWSPFQEEVDLLLEKRQNERLLKGVTLPNEIGVTSDIGVAKGSDITIIATPSTAIRSVAKKLSECENFGVVVNVAKGFEKGTFSRLSEVIKEELPNSKVAVLSGPSHAEEVARGIPTSVVVASDDIKTAEFVQEIMSNDTLRIYTADDLIGVELGGAIKNIIAIAGGFCDGLGLGDNTMAALITRGLAEMARLGIAMGAKEHTFMGLAGVGDLVVTCTSDHSRNHRFGKMVGEGDEVETALKAVGTVEGYFATEMAYSLAKKFGVDTPIIDCCYEVMYMGKPVKEVPGYLMNRPNRSEH